MAHLRWLSMVVFMMNFSKISAPQNYLLTQDLCVKSKNDGLQNVCVPGRTWSLRMYVIATVENLVHKTKCVEKFDGT